MGVSRHLIISDLHENHSALRRLLKKALFFFGGLDDIWLLGDIFGHSDQAVGMSNLTEAFFEGVRYLNTYPHISVWGNWEYWLGHPEKDEINEAQRDHKEALIQHREFLLRKGYQSFLDELLQHNVILAPEESPEFTLFHGCSYSCHGNSAYQPEPWECYLHPRDINLVTRGLFSDKTHLQTSHFLFGHTHVPGFFVYSKSSMMSMWRMFESGMAGHPISYANKRLRYGINPGSAGILANGLPRTAVLLDTNEKTFTYLTDDEGID